MFTSSRVSNWVLRLGLAAVFLWFGADKFVHPSYWLSAWIPGWMSGLAQKFQLNQAQLAYFIGTFEVAVGISLLTNFLLRLFSFLAIVLILIISTASGISEVTMRDFGLIGGLLALVFWQERRGRL